MKKVWGKVIARVRRNPKFVFVVVAAAVLVAITQPVISFGIDFGDSQAEESSTGNEPAEFLYLDSGRTLAYLAEMVGGTTTSEEHSSKLSNTVSGKLALKGLEAGAESKSEEEEHRVVTPTAASSYVELVKLLQEDEDLKPIENLACFQCMHRLSEGQFVRFHTDSMRAPAYLNPYLMVKQTGTLSAIFPFAEADRNATVKQQRKAARKFAKQIGGDPRIVFDLRPSGGGPDSIQYLLPAQYSGLTHERSLLKYGGGDFTVVGKVVRSFPEAARAPKQHNFAYVDSATRATWERPLRRALPALICRSEPQCTKRVKEHEEDRYYPQSDRTEDLRSTIAELRRGLYDQTEIRTSGAVILPIAIYK